MKIAGAIAAAIMFLAMWAQSGSNRCVVPYEAGRQLKLDRAIDADHLAADMASAARSAQRHAIPPGASADCEDRLLEAIATRHGVSLAEVRATQR
jgi:hypothetical protein